MYVNRWQARKYGNKYRKKGLTLFFFGICGFYLTAHCTQAILNKYFSRLIHIVHYKTIHHVGLIFSIMLKVRPFLSQTNDKILSEYVWFYLLVKTKKNYCHRI